MKHRRILLLLGLAAALRSSKVSTSVTGVICFARIAVAASVNERKASFIGLVKRFGRLGHIKFAD